MIKGGRLKRKKYENKKLMETGEEEEKKSYKKDFLRNDLESCQA
jgi:hypothetical protein